MSKKHRKKYITPENKEVTEIVKTDTSNIMFVNLKHDVVCLGLAFNSDGVNFPLKSSFLPVGF